MSITYSYEVMKFAKFFSQIALELTLKL